MQQLQPLLRQTAKQKLQGAHTHAFQSILAFLRSVPLFHLTFLLKSELKMPLFT